MPSPKNFFYGPRRTNFPMVCKKLSIGISPPKPLNRPLQILHANLSGAENLSKLAKKSLPSSGLLDGLALILSVSGNTATFSIYSFDEISLHNTSKPSSGPLGLSCNPCSLPSSSPLYLVNLLKSPPKGCPPYSSTTQV